MDEKKFNQAHEVYENGDYRTAFKLFLQAAEDGDVDAMNRIAIMYTCGEGVICDYDKSIEWEKKAIASGSTSALLNIGITYRIKGDIKLSKYWFEKSLDSGDGEAALQLAKLYLVSDKEIDRVKAYLSIAINSERMCEASIEEAKQLLLDLD